MQHNRLMNQANKALLQRFAMLGWVNAPFIFTGVQFLTEAVWTGSPFYDFFTNSVSQLGQVGCTNSAAGVVEVCSPAHTFFNYACMLIGALLLIGLMAIREI